MMKAGRVFRSQRAFTLVELMITVAIVAIILAVAAPSFRDYLLTQRLRGIQAQLVTDLQYARSEAVSRGNLVAVRFQSGSGMTCYIVNTRTSLAAPSCDCTAAAGSRCSDASQTAEVRTVQVPSDLSVTVGLDATQVRDFITLDPRTGGIRPDPSDLGEYDTNGFRVNTFIDSSRKIVTILNIAGNVSSCTPAGSPLGGVACP
jgi:type IV fimbrial biogenesis protein FimT